MLPKFLSRTGAIALLALACLPFPSLAEDWERQVYGRLQYDYTRSSGDQSGFSLDRGELRTGRVGLDLKSDRTKLRVELALNNDGDIEITDAYIKQALGGSGWDVRAGHFKTQNSLDEQTSGRFLAFYERAAFTDAFAFDRRVGVQLEHNGPRHSVYAGVFADNANQTAFSGGHAAAVRYLFTPVLTDTELLHFGVSVRWREAGDVDFRYRQRPVSHDAGALLSTSGFASDDLFGGAEAAWIHGPVWLAGEYGQLQANGAAGPDATFTGAYAEAGYVFGGHRTYEHSKFDRPAVYRPVTSGGPGALVLAARADRLDMTGNAVSGGQLDTYTLAADWFATPYVHAGINLYRAEAELGSTSSGLAPAFAAYLLEGGRFEDVTGISLRVQFDF